MTKFLIGDADAENGEDFDTHAIVHAENEKTALQRYRENIKIDQKFITYVHEWCDGFATSFFYDEDDSGQKPKPFSKKKAKQNVMEYFQEQPMYGELLLQHWNDEEYYKTIPDDCPDRLMKPSPEEMLRFIYIKKLLYGNRINLIIINLDTLPEI